MLPVILGVAVAVGAKVVWERLRELALQNILEADHIQKSGKRRSRKKRSKTEETNSSSKNKSENNKKHKNHLNLKNIIKRD